MMLTELAEGLRSDVEMLATRIGERNGYRPERLEAAAGWVEERLRGSGLTTRRLPVPVPPGAPYECGPQMAWNLEAEKPGTDLAHEVLIVGAHYDSKVATPRWYSSGSPQPDRPGTPGANDNASGVAAVLALARLLADIPTARTVRFVAFANEEPPFFQRRAMGSRIYARACVQDPSSRVVGAIIAETLGCYSRQGRTKRIPFASWIGLPARADYVAFLANWGSRHLMRAGASAFRRGASIELRAVALPDFWGLAGWSDDWSFAREGIPAFAVTDTAFLRSDHYHELTDTADRLDYGPMAEVVRGLAFMVEALANPGAGEEPRMDTDGTRIEGKAGPSVMIRGGDCRMSV
jgi:hypothetical protein